MFFTTFTRVLTSLSFTIFVGGIVRGAGLTLQHTDSPAVIHSVNASKSTIVISNLEFEKVQEEYSWIKDTACKKLTFVAFLAGCTAAQKEVFAVIPKDVKNIITSYRSWCELDILAFLVVKKMLYKPKKPIVSLVICSDAEFIDGIKLSYTAYANFYLGSDCMIATQENRFAATKICIVNTKCSNKKSSAYLINRIKEFSPTLHIKKGSFIVQPKSPIAAFTSPLSPCKLYRENTKLRLLTSNYDIGTDLTDYDPNFRLLVLPCDSDAQNLRMYYDLTSPIFSPINLNCKLQFSFK